MVDQLLLFNYLYLIFITCRLWYDTF